MKCNLGHYFVNPIKFEEHIKGMYEWNEGSYDTFKEGLMEKTSYAEIQNQFQFDVAIYPFVLELCTEDEKHRFHIFMRQHEFTHEDIWESLHVFLCFAYMIQYFFF